MTDAFFVRAWFDKLLLHPGDLAIKGNMDTGDAELDPDGPNLWFAHAYGDAAAGTTRFIANPIKP